MLRISRARQSSWLSQHRPPTLATAVLKPVVLGADNLDLAVVVIPTPAVSPAIT